MVEPYWSSGYATSPNGGTLDHSTLIISLSMMTTTPAPMTKKMAMKMKMNSVASIGRRRTTLRRQPRRSPGSRCNETPSHHLADYASAQTPGSPSHNHHRSASLCSADFIIQQEAASSSTKQPPMEVMPEIYQTLEFLGMEWKETAGSGVWMTVERLSEERKQNDGHRRVKNPLMYIVVVSRPGTFIFHHAPYIFDSSTTDLRLCLVDLQNQCINPKRCESTSVTLDNDNTDTIKREEQRSRQGLKVTFGGWGRQVRPITITLRSRAIMTVVTRVRFRSKTSPPTSEVRAQVKDDMMYYYCYIACITFPNIPQIVHWLVALLKFAAPPARTPESD